jgi:streptogramin lyase
MKNPRILARTLLILSLFIMSTGTVGVWTTSLRPVYAPPSPGTLTEWTVPTPNSQPWGLALDPNGDCCWFVEQAGNKVAHFDPSTGTFQEWAIPTAGALPYGIATTTMVGTPVVWGTEYAKDKIFVFVPAAGIFQEYSLPHASSGAEYVSIQPPGTDSNVRVWFTEIGRNGYGEAIFNQSAGTGGVTLYEGTFPAGVYGCDCGIYAASGSVWYATTHALVGWDRATDLSAVWPLPSHGSAAGRFLAFDATGQLWYTQGVTTATGNDNYVGVLRKDNTIKEWQVPTIGADPKLISINQLTHRPWIGEDSVDANNPKVAQLDPSAGGNVVAAAPTFSPSLFGGTPVGLAPVVYAPVGASTNVVTPATTPITGASNGQFNEYALASASQPHDVIVDSSGNTWILEAGANKVAKMTAAPDFLLHMDYTHAVGDQNNSTSVSVAQGASNDHLLIWGTSIQGYSGYVTLSVTEPAGVTLSFDVNPIYISAGSGDVSSLTVSVDSSVPTGSYPITVHGDDGSLTHTAVFTLIVTPGSSTSTTSVTTGSYSTTIAPPAVTQTSTSSSSTQTSSDLMSMIQQNQLLILGGVVLLAAVLIAVALRGRRKPTPTQPTKTAVTRGMVYCGKCGTKNPTANKFCGKCGTDLH